MFYLKFVVLINSDDILSKTKIKIQMISEFVIRIYHYSISKTLIIIHENRTRNTIKYSYNYLIN